MELSPDYVAAFITPHLSDPKRLLVLDRIHRDRLEDLHAMTQRAVSWNRALVDLQEDGKIRLNIWYRDCDCVEGYRTKVVAVDKVNQEVQSDLAYADGPMKHTLARPSEVPCFPRSRDRILEAFEDGHPWSV